MFKSKLWFYTELEITQKQKEGFGVALQMLITNK
jgi:hypothetical protein